MNSQLVLYVKSWIFPYVESGIKTLDVRLDSIQNQKYSTDAVAQVSDGGRRVCYRKIVARRTYRTLRELLDVESVEKIYPGVSRDVLRTSIIAIYPLSAIKKSGLLILELKAES